MALSAGQGAAAAPQGTAAPPAGAATANQRPRSEFAGTWQYNPDESINAATKRPENARAANDRRGVGRGPNGVAGRGAGGGGGGRGPSTGGSGMPQEGLYSIYLAARDARRDLLEIAPELRLVVTPAAVTVTDDLNRALTFPVDGKKQKYQLAATQFDARTSWVNDQLKIDIDGPDGLKITETWFLNEDASRLFLVIRVGEPAKGEPPVGVNRVYDRAR